MRSPTVGPSESTRELARALLMLTTAACALPVLDASAFFMANGILHQITRCGKAGDPCDPKTRQKLAVDSCRW
jgi:hypothetical protein